VNDVIRPYWSVDLVKSSSSSECRTASLVSCMLCSAAMHPLSSSTNSLSSRRPKQGTTCIYTQTSDAPNVSIEILTYVQLAKQSISSYVVTHFQKFRFFGKTTVVMWCARQCFRSLSKRQYKYFDKVLQHHCPKL